MPKLKPRRELTGYLGHDEVAVLWCRGDAFARVYINLPEGGREWVDGLLSLPGVEVHRTHDSMFLGGKMYRQFVLHVPYRYLAFSLPDQESAA